jgi:hypothetical protein
MIKHALIIWGIFGIFAILYFFITPWLYAIQNIDTKLSFRQHLIMTTREMKDVGIFWFLIVGILLGPIGLWFAIEGVDKARNDFENDRYDD